MQLAKLTLGRQAQTEVVAVVRSLVRRPFAAFLPVLILTLGLTGVGAVYAMVKSTQLNPLPFDQPAYLAHVAYAGSSDPRETQPLFAGDIRSLSQTGAQVQAVGAFSNATITLTEGDRGERFDGAYVTPGLFALLGVTPMLGRDFEVSDATTGLAPVILSHSVWTRRYGASPQILGQVVRANRVPSVVIGVMPEDFGFPFNQSVWLPLDLERAEPYAEQSRATAVVRVAPESSVSQLGQALQGRFAEWAKVAPEAHQNLRLVVHPLDQLFVDWQFRGFVNLLFGTLGALALIACANSASVLLAEYSTRAREVSVHFALGATPLRIAASVIARCTVLVGLAIAASLPLTQKVLDWSLAGLRAGEDPVPYWLRFQVDGGVIAFVTLVAVIALVTAAGLPALVTSRMAQSASLRSGSRVGPPPGALRLLNGLLATQVCFAVIAVTSGVICAMAFAAMLRMDLGVTSAGIMTARVALPEQRYRTPEDRMAFVNNVRERLRASQGVKDVAFTTDLPGFSGSRTRVALQADASQEEWTPIRAAAVDSGFFSTFKLGVVAGRAIDERDTAATERVAMIDEVLASRLAPGRVAIGLPILIDLGEETPVLHLVVGVVRRLHLAQVDDPREPAALIALAQDPPRFVTAAIRVSGDPKAFQTVLANAIRAADPEAPPYWLRSADEAVAYGRGTVLFLASWFVGVGALSLVLTAFGLFGVAQIRATVQSKEIGIRRALGGGSVRILVALAKPMAGSVLLGLGLGAMIAWPIGRLAAGLAPGVVTADVRTALSVMAAMVVAGLAAGSWPALRAVRVSPCETLRAE